MSLEGTMVKDHRNDTLMYAGKVNVRLTDWFFLRDRIVLKYIGLEDAHINMHRVDSTWNYAFLIDYFSAPPSTKKKKGIDLDLKTVDLKNIHFLRKDEWRGEDIWFHVRSMDLDAKEINLTEKTVEINRIDLADPLFSIYNYTGFRPKRTVIEKSEDPPLADTTLKWNPDSWKFSIGQVKIKNGIFKTSQKADRPVNYYFDGQNMLFSSINSTIRNVRLMHDTVHAKIDLNTKERSGFQVRSLTADFKMYPQGMEFSRLDIRTNKSHLRNYFAMHYNEFDDLSDFIDKVEVEGVFRNTELESDDIAFFAPEVSTCKKLIFFTG
jgi:uncharacterized protein involved in outer membrane biogenesis